jgi:predicted nucleic acid-binding protein
VVNTSPLQYLFRIHRLQLLKDLFEAVLVAEGVRTELEQGPSLGFQVPDLSQ